LLVFAIFVRRFNANGTAAMEFRQRDPAFIGLFGWIFF
jgi:hypothetical protein